MVDTIPQDFTNEEIEMIAVIKDRLKADNHKVPDLPEIYNDFWFVRFVRARDGEEDAVYEMTRDSLAWRLESKVDTIREWFPKDPEAQRLIDYWPSQVHGVDTKGRGIIYERMSLIDSQVLMRLFAPELILNFHLWLMECTMKRLLDHSIVKGEYFYGCTVVQDLSLLSWAHWYTPAVDILKAILALDGKNYPEQLVSFHVINAPRLFAVLYKMVAPMIDPATREKVRVCSGLESLFEDEHIINSSIPLEYGGECTRGCRGEADSDRCLKDAGGDMLMSVDGLEMIALDIPARDSREVDIQVTEPNSILGYEFSTISNDIEFELYLMKPGKKSKKQVVVKKYRPPSHVESVCDSIDCKIGTYTFVFDNAYSWTTAKKVLYRIGVEVCNPNTANTGKRNKNKKKKKKKKGANKKKVVCKDCEHPFKDPNTTACSECGGKEKKLL